MTRETKIGLLTGLVVIVLIGVLMSDYLNKGPSGVAEANLSQTMGADYRAAQLAPGHLPNASLALTPSPGGSPAEFTTQTGAAGNLPLAAASFGATPRVDAPAVPVPLGAATSTTGQAAPLAASAVLPDAGTSTVFVPGQVALPQPMQPRVAAVTPAAGPAGQSYVVVKGDALSRLARRFYGSASAANMQRIIAANRRLKDTHTPLLVGEKLIIPGVDGSTALAPAPDLRTVADPARDGRTVIGIPGHTRLRPSPAAPQRHAAAAPAPRSAGATYTVRKGDTLAAIARRTMGSSSRATLEALAKANGLKNLNAVRVGQVLTIPH